MASARLSNPTRRKSNLALVMIGVVGTLFLVSLMLAWMGRIQAQEALAEKQRLVSALQLTDLCLFTEARYTRHPTQADLHTPFQDHPLSLDHFPSGSLMRPPAGLKGER
jgi:hypothetical protein